MKRIVLVLAALVSLAFLLCSCEKHAYSESWSNFFTVVQGESRTLADRDKAVELKVGETVYIYASDRDKNRKAGGKYSFDNNSEGIVSASLGSNDGGETINVTGSKPGNGSVYVHWLWRGFDLHKAISFTVTE